MYSPDEIRSIRAELNRDAMPSPDEIEQMNRERECERCGEPNTDGETVTAVQRSYDHDCSATQHPHPDPIDLCPDCRADHDPEGEYVARFASRDETYARFSCGVVEKAEPPEPPMIDMGDGEEIPAPHADTRPQVPIECRCGAPFETLL